MRIWGCLGDSPHLFERHGRLCLWPRLCCKVHLGKSRPCCFKKEASLGRMNGCVLQCSALPFAQFETFENHVWFCMSVTDLLDCHASGPDPDTRLSTSGEMVSGVLLLPICGGYGTTHTNTFVVEMPDGSAKHCRWTFGSVAVMDAFQVNIWRGA